MHKLIGGGMALMAMVAGGSAVAADMPLKAPPPPVPVYTWTGCYVGLSGGESFGHANGFEATGATRTPVAPTALGTLGAIGSVSDSFNLSGAIGGAFVGCNYQTGAFVFGAEGDFSFTNKEGQAFNLAVPTAFTPAGLLTPGTDVFSLKERWLSTARVRLGFTPWDRTLLYVTGGVAWAKIDSAQWQTGLPPTTRFGTVSDLQSDTRVGWTVGAGLEYALGYGWTIRSEYLYVDFGSYTTFTNVPAAGPFDNPNGPFTNLSVKLHNNIFRFGMAYKFDWAPAVVAKY